MVQKQFPRFLIDDIPEYQRLKAANPQNQDMDSLQAITMYGRAIHWASIFDIIVDSLGALLAGILLWKLQHILPKKLSNWLNN